MSDAPGGGRRHSSRLREKENTQLVNGVAESQEPFKKASSSYTSVGSKGAKATTGTKSSTKRKLAYDEEDDGFAFTRTKSKRAKAEPSATRAQDDSSKIDAGKTTEKKAKKRFEDRPSIFSLQNEDKLSQRRSTRLSGDSHSGEEALPVRKRRKEGGQDASSASDDRFSIHTDATKIALPFADTPVIRRNQQMRREASNGSRRSSLGMRGRRASSLIDSGKSNAVPHDEVDGAFFYKHIESVGLSEPRRMKQLLTWCGTRAMAHKPPMGKEDANAVLAAREIQSQLLKEFSANSTLSDWFSRVDGPAPPTPPRANPKNIANQAKVRELEEQLARLKQESSVWEELKNKPPAHLDLSSNASAEAEPASLSLDSALLPSSTSEIVATMASASSNKTLASTVSERLGSLTSDLEFSIDSFASNTHVLASYKDVAGRLAEEALGKCARILDERERDDVRRANVPSGDDSEQQEQQEGASMREVLRGLSRVIDQ